jgi:hypothetical protein
MAARVESAQTPLSLPAPACIPTGSRTPGSSRAGDKVIVTFLDAQGGPAWSG